MDATKKLWLGLGTLLVVSFAVLLWAGTEIFRSAPPMPERVVAEDGRVLYTRADIERSRVGSPPHTACNSSRPVMP